MLSLLGREARRFHGIRAFERLVVTNPALQSLQVPQKSRELSTSSPYGHESSEEDVIAVRGVRARGGGVALPTWGGWEARKMSNLGKGKDVLSIKVSEALAGIKQGTASLLQRWVPPLVLLGALPIALSARYHSGLLPRSLEEEEDDEEEGSGLEGESWGDAAGAAGLSEGVWQTSVRRKRVSKMRKHKWRKRRRVERQSASRRVKN